jgi:hypothetical protein
MVICIVSLNPFYAFFCGITLLDDFNCFLSENSKIKKIKMISRPRYYFRTSDDGNVWTTLFSNGQKSGFTKVPNMGPINNIPG